MTCPVDVDPKADNNPGKAYSFFASGKCDLVAAIRDAQGSPELKLNGATNYGTGAQVA